jgi:hypothetical protein
VAAEDNQYEGNGHYLSELRVLVEIAGRSEVLINDKLTVCSGTTAQEVNTKEQTSRMSHRIFL